MAILGKFSRILTVFSEFTNQEICCTNDTYMFPLVPEERMICMFVANRMTKNPITVDPTTPVYEAANLMKRRHIRRLPVVEEGKLVGIISDRDIMRVAPSPATTLSRFEITSLLDKITISEIMAKDVVAIKDTATIEEAALLMYNEKVGGLPVVSSIGAVVGIITETDVFKTFVDVMGLADGKTRITLDVEDKIGVVKELAGIIADAGFNIDSMATCKMAANAGHFEIVIRVDTDEVDNIIAKIEEKGYKVLHVAKIG